MEGQKDKLGELNSVQIDSLIEPFAPDSITRATETAMHEALEPCLLLDAAHERGLSASEVSLFHLATTGFLQFSETAKHAPKVPARIIKSMRT